MILYYRWISPNSIKKPFKNTNEILLKLDIEFHWQTFWWIFPSSELILFVYDMVGSCHLLFIYEFPIKPIYLLDGSLWCIIKYVHVYIWRRLLDLYMIENGQWKGDNTLDRSQHKKNDKLMNTFCNKNTNKYFYDLCIILASYLSILFSE